MTWWHPLVPLVSAILGAGIGGIVVHRLTLRREALSTRRSQRVAFLLDAYRKLIDASERENLSPQRRDNLEGALADIMLLGGEQEIEVSDRFQRDFAAEKGASLVPVIESLRRSLRNELDLPEIDLPKPFNFRLHLEGESGEDPYGIGSDHVPSGRVIDKVDLLRQINMAQKSKTGQVLTDERQKQLFDAYDQVAVIGPRRVLWVDDNRDWIESERGMLEAAGVSTVWVPNTSRALDLLDGNVFQAVITDMGRDEGSREGFALLDAIRQRGDDTPLIVYSESNQPAYLQAVVDRGGQGATNDPSRLFELVMKEVAL